MPCKAKNSSFKHAPIIQIQMAAANPIYSGYPACGKFVYADCRTVKSQIVKDHGQLRPEFPGIMYHAEESSVC